MTVLRPLLLVLSALPCLAATFGTVVPHAQPLADLVIDEARKRLYVVNTYSSTVEVYATNVSPPRADQHHQDRRDAPIGGALPRNAHPPLSLRRLLRRFHPRHHRPQLGELLLRLQTTRRQTAGRGRRLQRQGPDLHRGHRHRRRGAGHLRSRCRDNPGGVGGSAGAGGARAASAERHHVSRREEPFAGIAGRQTHYRRQSAGRHPHRLRVRCSLIHRARQPRRAGNLAHARGIARRQQVPQRSHALRHPDAGRAGAAEHDQLAVRLPGQRELQRADQPGRGGLPAGRVGTAGGLQHRAHVGARRGDAIPAR